MNCSKDVERMCTVTKGPNHGPAPIPEEGRWVKAYDVKDISALSHGVGTCAPQQGACKLTLNVKKRFPFGKRFWHYSASSARRPGHVASGKHVKVQVRHALSRLLAPVRHHAEA